MAARRGHFMPVALLDSQFAALEPLGGDEAGAAVEVSGTVEEVVAQALRALPRTGGSAPRPPVLNRRTGSL